MTKVDYEILRSDYQILLDILEELNAYLIIIDKPRIGLPVHARHILAELEESLSDTEIPQTDKRSVEAFSKMVRMFCYMYFDATDLDVFPAICPLRLPCDSHELFKVHEDLKQQYLDLKTNLRVSVRNLKASVYMV